MRLKKSKKILEELEAIRRRDAGFEDGRILCSMSTKPADIGVKAYEIFSDTNLLDSYLFPNTSKLEARLIKRLGIMLNAAKPAGYITSGGTESNIVALWIAKKSRPDANELVLPESAHYSFEKAADLMGLKVVRLALDGQYKADVSKLKLSDKTLAVVASCGTTDLGVVDPISDIGVVCEKNNVPFHVDAAFGGLVLPYLENLGYTVPLFDFRCDGVFSVSIDPHKMGLAPIPAGALLLRDDLLKMIESTPEYLMNPATTLLGSRSGGSVAATWAILEYVGEKGFENIVKECMDHTFLLYDELKEIPLIKPLIKPQMNILAFRAKDNTQKIYETLVRLGWKLSFNKQLDCIRIIIMPHIKKEDIEAFVSDLKKAVLLN